jgi:hypothetical protein
MDQTWMYNLTRIDPMYLENVCQFVEEAKRHANRQNKNDIFLSYPVFTPKLSTHRMYDPGSIVPHIWPKVLTDNPMS